MLFEPPGVHIPLRARERGALAGRPDARLGQSDPLAAFRCFLSAPAKKGIKKKNPELVKSHTAFRSNFYPVSLWKSFEQAQCFKAEAANLPGKVPVFNKLF